MQQLNVEYWKYKAGQKKPTRVTLNQHKFGKSLFAREWDSIVHAHCEERRVVNMAVAASETEGRL